MYLYISISTLRYNRIEFLAIHQNTYAGYREDAFIICSTLTEVNMNGLCCLLYIWIHLYNILQLLYKTYFWCNKWFISLWWWSFVFIEMILFFQLFFLSFMLNEIEIHMLYWIGLYFYAPQHIIAFDFITPPTWSRL